MCAGRSQSTEVNGLHESKWNTFKLMVHMKVNGRALNLYLLGSNMVAEGSSDLLTSGLWVNPLGIRCGYQIPWYPKSKGKRTSLMIFGSKVSTTKKDPGKKFPSG